MTSLILYAVDQSQSNIDCDVAPLRQILTKCSKIKHVYEVLCAKQTRKIWCNNVYRLHYTDVAIFWYLGLCFGRILKKMKSGTPHTVRGLDLDDFCGCFQLCHTRLMRCVWYASADGDVLCWCCNADILIYCRVLHRTEFCSIISGVNVKRHSLTSGYTVQRVSILLRSFNYSCNVANIITRCF